MGTKKSPRGRKGRNPSTIAAMSTAENRIGMGEPSTTKRASATPALAGRDDAVAPSAANAAGEPPGGTTTGQNAENLGGDAPRDGLANPARQEGGAVRSIDDEGVEHDAGGDHLGDRGDHHGGDGEQAGDRRDEHEAWTRKYRPRRLDDLILPARLAEILQAFIKKGTIPHLILKGPPGLGKSTAAKVLAEHFDVDEYTINASMERGIDVVRRQMTDFAYTMSFRGGGKILILEEAENLTDDAQRAMLSPMDEVGGHCGFFFTCNDASKIIEAIHSRCAGLDFTPTADDEASECRERWLRRVREILDREGVSYDLRRIQQIVGEHFPDYRRTLNELQALAAADGLRVSDVTTRNAHDTKGVAGTVDTGGQPSATDRQSGGLLVSRASEIEPVAVHWLWPDVIPLGKLTGLAGHPGLGKSQVALDVAARVSTGTAWPGNIANEMTGDVIILSAEDDAADTLVPRLIAAAADRQRVHLVRAVKEENGVERVFNLALDLDRIEHDISLQNVRLLIIDPASAYLIPAKGKQFDRNRAGDVRSVLQRLADFAARHGLAVLAVSHLNKGGGAKAITRVMGSQEWVAAPRAVYLVTEEPGSQRRLFLPLKNNLGPDRSGFAFDLTGKTVAGVGTSAVEWSAEPITISADEALAVGRKTVSSGAEDFLREVLQEGSKDHADIVRRGKEAGFTEKNLRTAREKLGVVSRKEGFGRDGKWVWALPAREPKLQLVVDNTPIAQVDSTGGDDAHRGEQGVAPPAEVTDSEQQHRPDEDEVT